MVGMQSDKDDVLAPQQEDALPSPTVQTPPVAHNGDDAAQYTQKRKKIKSAELEEMHATSQRLLRESTNAYFKPQVTAGKSVTSVLEKIRLRKKQLVQGKRSAFSILPPDSTESLEILDEELAFVRTSALQVQNDVEDDEFEGIGTQENEVQKTIDKDSMKNAGREESVASLPEGHDEADIDVVKPSEIHDVAHTSINLGKPTYLGVGNAFRAPMEDTQDLLSCSEASDDDLDDILHPDKEEYEDYGGSRVNLQLDTETQDDNEEWLDEDGNKENMEPTSLDKFPNKQIFKGPSVRALIDDEAEDEDEDALVPGEDDEGDEYGDLDDMIVKETNEKVRDKEKRAELHRKWLEQQDAVMTDDILSRLKTGWRPRESRKRGLEFLDDDLELSMERERIIEESPHADAELHVAQELPDENTQDEEALKDYVDPDEKRVFRSLEDLNDVHESSDDEEAEQRMMRQRFFEESEAQGEFMSPADDETSREIFGLINKVNIASSTKKVKHGTVNDLKYSSGGSSNSNLSFTSKSSFLRRTASSSLGSVQRQGSNSGSASRSFIFGRDDSNSSHSFDQHADLRDIKENLDPAAQGLKKAQTRNSSQGIDNQKAMKPSAKKLGPSLFEILRRQSTDLDHSLQDSSCKQGSLPISPSLSAFKPIKSTSTPRGFRRG